MMLASSAPEAPGVMRDSRAAASPFWRGAAGCSPVLSGRAAPPARGGQNGRDGSSAGSRDSGRLVGGQDHHALGGVEAVHLGEQQVSASVPARRCRPTAPAPSRFLPMVSISSMKTMQGAFSPACLKRSRTLEAPMPTNISHELAARDGEEGHTRLTGHGPGQQRLAGTRRAHQPARPWASWRRYPRISWGCAGNPRSPASFPWPRPRRPRPGT